MKAYIAQIIYRIDCDGVFTDRYEEKRRVVYANNPQEAVNVARNMGKKEEASMVDRNGHTLLWQMLAVKDIQPVELNSGNLIFSVAREPELRLSPVMAR